MPRLSSTSAAANPRWSIAVPRDGAKHKVEFTFDATKPDLIPSPDGAHRARISPLRIELSGQRKVVKSVRLSAEVLIKIVSLSSSEALHHTYKSDDGLVAQHARFKGEVFGVQATFDLATRGADVSGVVEFPSGARLELGWVEHYEARSQGVSATWLLRQPPVGNGALIIEAELAGLRCQLRL